MVTSNMSPVCCFKEVVRQTSYARKEEKTLSQGILEGRMLGDTKGSSVVDLKGECW